MSEEPTPRRSGRRLLFGVLFGLVVYAAMALWADVGPMLDALSDFPLWLLPVAMALSFLNYVVRFPRWERYRRLVGVDLDRKTSFFAYLAGLSLTVSPGKMGEVYKSWLVKRACGAPIHRTAPIVLAERVTDLVGFLVLIAVGGLATSPEHAWIFWATLALCAVLLVLVGSERAGKLVVEVAHRTPARHAADKIEGALASTRTLLRFRELPVPVVLATLGWSLECLGFWLVANGMLDQGSVPLSFATYSYALSAVAGAVLVIFPGGLGVTEASMGALLTREYGALGVAADLARSKAASAVILIRLCTLWFAVGVGLVAATLFERRMRGTEATGRASAQKSRVG